MKQSAQKIYTDILENETRSLDFQRTILVELNKFNMTETKFRKIYFQNFGRVSLSTYNKYLRELKNGTYVRCERD